MVSPSVVVGVGGPQVAGSQLTPVAWDPFAPGVIASRDPHRGIAWRWGRIRRSRGVDIAPGFDGGQGQEHAECNPMD